MAISEFIGGDKVASKAITEEKIRSKDVENTCNNCKNFILHYSKPSKDHYCTTCYGHCIKPRIKRRNVDDKACAHWEEIIEK